MNTKLTLTMDDAIIKDAKAYAEEQGRSLSNMVEHYFKAITQKKTEPAKDEHLSPLLRSLKGAFKMTEEFDYKEELNKIRDEKYQKYLENNNR